MGPEDAVGIGVGVGNCGGLKSVEDEVACVESLLRSELGWLYELKWAEELCEGPDMWPDM